MNLPEALPDIDQWVPTNNPELKQPPDEGSHISHQPPSIFWMKAVTQTAWISVAHPRIREDDLMWFVVTDENMLRVLIWWKSLKK